MCPSSALPLVMNWKGLQADKYNNIGHQNGNLLKSKLF